MEHPTSMIKAAAHWLERCDNPGKRSLVEFLRCCDVYSGLNAIELYITCYEGIPIINFEALDSLFTTVLTHPEHGKWCMPVIGKHRNGPVAAQALWFCALKRCNANLPEEDVPPDFRGSEYTKRWRARWDNGNTAGPTPKQRAEAYDPDIIMEGILNAYKEELRRKKKQ